MEIADLQKLAERTRFMREAGMALLLGSAVLGAFIFVPLGFGKKKAPQPPEAAAVHPAAFAAVPMDAQAAIVYDLAEKKVLYEKNAHAQLPLASLTKLLTVYTALSSMPSDTMVTVPADAATVDAPRAFTPGERFALNDLARITLTASLNDGAVTMAEAAAAQANTTTSAALAGAAAAVGLSQTYATNGSGLDESTSISGGYGSAQDIALLAGALVAKAPDVVAATTHATASAVSASGKSFTVKNTDPMTGQFPHLLLSKTGFTDLAGGNLALVYDAGIGHPIAVVVLGSTEKARFTDAAALVSATEAYFANQSSL